MTEQLWMRQKHASKLALLAKQKQNPANCCPKLRRPQSCNQWGRSHFALLTFIPFPTLGASHSSPEVGSALPPILPQSSGPPTMRSCLTFPLIQLLLGAQTITIPLPAPKSHSVFKAPNPRSFTNSSQGTPLPADSTLTGHIGS